MDIGAAISGWQGSLSDDAVFIPMALTTASPWKDNILILEQK